MIPVKQTILSSEDGTVKGNCMSACLASILELDINDVPHFADMHVDEWGIKFHEFLYQHNCRMYGTIHNIDELKTYPGIDGYVLVCGPSYRIHVKNGHSVIYRYGEFVFDPHPSNEGLKEFEYAYMIERI